MQGSVSVEVRVFPLTGESGEYSLVFSHGTTVSDVLGWIESAKILVGEPLSQYMFLHNGRGLDCESASQVKLQDGDVIAVVMMLAGG